MALVPADLVNQAPKPADVQVSTLDQEMRRILDDPSLPAEIKFKMYNQALHQHNEIKAESRKPVEIPIKEVKGAKKPRLPLERMMKGIPDKKSEQAAILADFLQQHTLLNDRNELIVNNSPLPGSNITDLFHYATRDLIRPPPPGWEEFYAMLKRENVPREAIGNRKLNYLGIVPESPATPRQPPPADTPRRPQRGRGFKWESLYK